MWAYSGKTLSNISLTKKKNIIFLNHSICMALTQTYVKGILMENFRSIKPLHQNQVVKISPKTSLTKATNFSLK